MKDETGVQNLVRTLRARAPDDAAELLARESPEFIRDTLKLLPDGHARKVAEHLPLHMRPIGPHDGGEDIAMPESLIELMDPISASVPVGTTVAAAVEAVRRAQVPTELTYLYVTDEGNKLLGLVDSEVPEAVHRKLRQQSQCVRTFNVKVRHVMGLIEERAGMTPCQLLVSPIGELRLDDRESVRPDFRITQQLDRASGAL